MSKIKLELRILPVQENGADAGKPAFYMLRWVNPRGERGPWSQTVSATITA
jgi:hypothetical protein